MDRRRSEADVVSSGRKSYLYSTPRANYALRPTAPKAPEPTTVVAPVAHVPAHYSQPAPKAPVFQQQPHQPKPVHATKPIAKSAVSLDGLKPVPVPWHLAKPDPQLIPKSRPQPLEKARQHHSQQPTPVVAQRLTYTEARALERPQKAKRKRAKNVFSHLRLSPGITSIAVLIFLLGGYASYSSWRTNHVVRRVAGVSTTLASDTSKVGAKQPSQDPVSANDLATHQVGPTEPRYISIKKLNVKARVLGADVDTDSQPQFPSNIADASWFNSSAMPGDNGTILINGYAKGSSKPGLFSGVQQLVIGDVLTIERGDGTVFNYKIVDVQKFTNGVPALTVSMPASQQKRQGLSLVIKMGTDGASQQVTFINAEVDSSQ